MPPKRNDKRGSPGSAEGGRSSAMSPSLALSPTRGGGGYSPSGLSPGGGGSPDQHILEGMYRDFPTVDRSVVKESYEKAVVSGHVGRARKSLNQYVVDQQRQVAVIPGRSHFQPDREPEPEPAPAPRTPAAVATTYHPRKYPKDQDWRELSKRNQKYAEQLGWNASTWDGGDQTPFEQLWTALGKEKLEAAAALMMDKSMFAHAHDSEDFWETIAQVQSDGLIGMAIASTVKREMEEKDLLWGDSGPRDPAEAVRGRLTELLWELDQFEQLCEEIYSTATASDRFEDMKNMVLKRDEMAKELYPRVDGMLQDVENMFDDLERRCESIRKCQAEIEQAGSVEEHEEDGELLLLSKEEMQGCLDAFYELFDRNAFDPETNTTREGASVLGHDLRNNVQELMAAQTEALRVMTKVQNGETFNAKDGAEAVRRAKTHAKEMWTKLVEADIVAGALQVAGRDFLDSQLHLAQGVRWEAATLRYEDDGAVGIAVPGRVENDWELWDRVADDCTKLLRQSETGTMSSSAAIPRLYTVEGVSLLVEVLKSRKAKLDQHPRDVEMKDELGKEIVCADVQIDVLTHRLFCVQNRVLEHTHAEKIDDRLDECACPIAIATAIARG